MKGNIVVCGDSFSIGIGCHDLKNEPYGSLIAKHFDRNIFNFAKGSSSNLSIYLQAKYAIENVENIDLLLIGTTCNYRTEWFRDDLESNVLLDNTVVNYHEYPPYMKNSYETILENPMKNDKNYKGKMFTENYFGIVDYVDNVITNNDTSRRHGYYARFRTERDEKMKLLKDHYLNFHDPRIQVQYNVGQIVLATILANNKNIKFLIIDRQIQNYFDFVSKDNLIELDWIKLSEKYPDDMNTRHTSEIGHKLVFKQVLDKIENNEWFK